jgi:hypothetical protein
MNLTATADPASDILNVSGCSGIIQPISVSSEKTTDSTMLAEELFVPVKMME